MNNIYIEDKNPWKNINPSEFITKENKLTLYTFDANDFIYTENPTSVTEAIPANKYLSLVTQYASTFDKFKSDFPEISKEIENSSYILTLLEDWDDNGAMQISTNIYVEATQFLKKYALHILKNYNIRIVSPSINPVKDGTIDLEWHTPNARFLINFKDEQVASYYGDNNNNLNSIKGRISVLDVEEYLAAWMAKLR
jgi:hypothetical protein